MTTTTYTAFRGHLAGFMDKVSNDHDVLYVTRQKARTVVVMAEEEYDGLLEAAHLLRSPANATRLIRAIADANAGKLIEQEI
jgi:antitoxin YefM